MDAYADAERIILGLLLQEHPRMLPIEELRATLSDVPALDDAIGQLSADGLASQLGDRVGATRAAVRFGQLSPI